jgi:hypothetical protein
LLTVTGIDTLGRLALVTLSVWSMNHERIERLTHDGIAVVFKPGKVRIAIPGGDKPPIPDLIGRRLKQGPPGCGLAPYSYPSSSGGVSAAAPGARLDTTCNCRFVLPAGTTSDRLQDLWSRHRLPEQQRLLV